MPTRALAIVVVVLAGLGSLRLAVAQNFPSHQLAAPAAPDVLDHRVPADVPPLNVKGLEELAVRLAIPFGFEEIDALAERVSSPFNVRARGATPLVSVRPRMVHVGGLTLRQALDAVVGAERRYEWRDLDGVVVVRPVAAWQDAAHPLLRPAPALRLHEARVSEAYDAVHRVVDARSTGSARALDDEPPLSLDFPGGTLFDLLNALARAHGRLRWSLTSKAETIFLDGTRAVDAVEPRLSLGGESVSVDIRFVFAATPR